MIKNLSLVRLVVFAISIMALSNFFEAGKLISTEMTFKHVGASLFSLLVFIFTLFVMGYWVYAEEKGRSNLKIKFGLYEWLYNKFALGGGKK